MQSLKVHVLINRQQLSDLTTALDTVIQAMKQVKLTQGKFFQSLQAVAAQTEKNPDAIANAKNLRESALLPRFINSLPYKSEILSLDDERFASLTTEERSALETRLYTRLQHYRDINEQVDGWIRMDVNDPAVKEVFPVPLDILP